jgi:hypothetical protein
LKLLERNQLLQKKVTMRLLTVLRHRLKARLQNLKVHPQQVTRHLKRHQYLIIRQPVEM